MIYKLFGNVLAGVVTDSMASADIQNTGHITALAFNVDADGMDALNDHAKLEVSFMSTNTFTTNDVRGSVAMHGVTLQFLTTGGGIGSNSLSISGLSIPVEAGERIHLHSSASAGVTAGGTCYLYIDDGVDDGGRAKRRLR